MTVLATGGDARISSPTVDFIRSLKKRMGSERACRQD
jgi:hypothetical protein